MKKTSAVIWAEYNDNESASLRAESDGIHLSLTLRDIRKPVTSIEMTDAEFHRLATKLGYKK